MNRRDRALLGWLTEPPNGAFCARAGIDLWRAEIESLLADSARQALYREICQSADSWRPRLVPPVIIEESSTDTPPLFWCYRHPLSGAVLALGNRDSQFRIPVPKWLVSALQGRHQGQDGLDVLWRN